MQIIAYIVPHPLIVELVLTDTSNHHQMHIFVFLVNQFPPHVHHHNLNSVLQWVIRLLGVLVFYVQLVQLQIVLIHVCKMVIIILVIQQCKDVPPLMD